MGIADGLSGKQIALKLGISIRTGEVHRARALRRLGVRTMAEAVRLWTLVPTLVPTPALPPCS